MKPIIIGISGGSGSGKSTVSNGLKKHYGEKLTMIHFDDYYKNIQEGQNIEDVNFDHPDQLDREMFKEQILDLAAGKTISKPKYDFTTHSRVGFEDVEPNDIILIDGLFALYDDELNKSIDLKIFVDMDADLRILRRVQRDINERGRDVDSIIDQYIKTVKSSHYLYIAPQKWKADLVIPNNVVRETPKIEEVIFLINANLKEKKMLKQK